MIILAAATAAMALSGCKKLDPYFTAGEDDYPRILNSTYDQTGKPNTYPSIYRDEMFTFELLYTPVQFSEVTWYIDGELAYTGANIEVSLLAGVHDVDVYVTTTKGKETCRKATLEVLARPEDPALATDAKSRWLQMDTRVTVSGTNLSDVVKAYLLVSDSGATKAEASMVELQNFENDGSAISFDVPFLSNQGEYSLIFETSDGARYGAGKFVVSPDKYVEPGKVEKKIWEGAVDINWGDSNVRLTAEQLAEVPAGTELTFHYEIIEADYHALRVTNNDWTYDFVPQVDAIHETYPTEYTYVYTAEDKATAEAEGDAMLITGFGYKMTSVTYMAEGGQTVEIKVWEGATDINWGDSNVQLTAAELSQIPAGTEITLHYEIIEADYHALRVTNNDWTYDIVPQVDAIHETYPTEYTFVYTEEAKAKVEAEGGAMVITGFGYKLTSVTYVGQAPAETVIWEGATDINWGDSNVQLSAEDLAGVAEGQTIVLTYEIIEADYHALRVTNQDWSSDLVSQVDEINVNYPDGYEFTYTAGCIEAVGEGAMVVTGFGYKLTKIAVK